ncbi:Peripheral-type benzodiazepine receptor-associated protein 1 [Dissostichus eleginoides]|uniref:Peripheral-type benzodiazepine receptor-associated protein 1 n=1 Tax=Dissostichus eleginoides TaxID=100907 RepID=A0AAD9B708_DISEL|nr:Peripheral-type benzodiazepine receptor-associated protein 1 [Dissostichus eleginoides]
MDRTKSDQSNKETSDSQNDESLLQFDAETVKLLVMRGDELFECVTICEERYSALEEEMEAKEAQHKQQLEENLVTINLLKRREEELLQSQEKSTKDLAEKQQSWESGKQGMKYVVDKTNYQAARNHTLESEKQKMEWKVKGVMKHNSQQTFRIHTLEKEVQKLVLQLKKQGEKISEDQQPMETKLKEVEKQKNHLAKFNKSWETDVKQLKGKMREQEEKFSEDLAENHLSWESEKHQLEDERREMETTLKQVEESKKKLAEENHSLELDVKLKDLLLKQFEKDMEVQEE